VTEGVELSGASAWLPCRPNRASSNPVRIAVLDLVSTEAILFWASSSGRHGPPLFPFRRRHRRRNKPTERPAPRSSTTWPRTPNSPSSISNRCRFRSAVDFLISQARTSFLLAVWTGAGAGDGTGPICQAVTDADAAGILWVNAAGDDGQSHWGASFQTRMGFLSQFFRLRRDLQWEVPAGGTTRAILVWNDWGSWTGSSYGAPTQDYDLLLWRWNGAAGSSSNTATTGRRPGRQRPLEHSSLWTSAGKTTYVFRSLNTRPATPDLRSDHRRDEAGIEYAVAKAVWPSRPTPKRASPSSRGRRDQCSSGLQLPGPTGDGRIKPDLVAFSGVRPGSTGPAFFSGTSPRPPTWPALSAY
jgi:hypothetical protein